MNRMVGIILMLVGSLFLISGIFVFVKSPVNEPELSSKQHPTNKPVVISDTLLQLPIQDETIAKPLMKKEKAVPQLAGSAHEDIELMEETRSEATASKTVRVPEESKKPLPGLGSEKKKKGDDFEKFIIQKFNRKYFNIKEWAGDKYVEGLYAETTLNPDMILELDLKEGKKQFAVECKWKQNLYRNGVEVATNAQLDRYRKFEAEKGIPVFMTVGIDGEASSPKDLFVIPLKEISDNFIHISQLKKYQKEAKERFFFDLKTEILR